MKKIYYFLLILPIFFLSACSLSQNNSQKIDDVNRPVNPTSKNDTLDNPATNNSIISESLGIKVSYYSSSTNEVFAKEEGNKIYFWNKFNQNYKDGQSLEVFVKDKNISFDKAIEDLFLKDEKYKNNCYVNIIEDTLQYRKVIIDFKKPAKLSDNSNCMNGDPSPSCDSCPEHYSKTNASLYFIYYKNHPDKFFYLVEGQESLVGGYDYYWYGNGDPREWFNNIEFIK